MTYYRTLRTLTPNFKTNFDTGENVPAKIPIDKQRSGIYNNELFLEVVGDVIIVSDLLHSLASGTHTVSPEGSDS